MDKIEVKILDHNLNGTPLFLAKLTQRGNQMHNMQDLLNLYKDNLSRTPSLDFMKLPHSTIFRMCNLTVAIYGLSTKAVSQLRTHATRLTFVSTSTQYSDYANLDLPYVIPEGLTPEQRAKMEEGLKNIHIAYKEVYKDIGDKDKAGYMLPQSLRKCLIISGNFPAWQYMLSLRLCNRNTREVQYICQSILNAIDKECGKVWADVCLPNCVTDKCKEGKFSCGHKYKDIRENAKNEDGGKDL